MPDRAEIAKEAVRITALTNVGGDNSFKIGDLVDENDRNFVSYAQDKHGLYKVAIRLPDGSTEFWQQTNGVHNIGTDFRAMAFERCNEDGSPYLEEGCEPVTMITFSGHTGSDKDSDTINKIVRGEDISDRYHNIESFVDDVVGDMRERAAMAHHGMGRVIIGAHSMGSAALGAGAYIRNQYGIEDTETYLLNPVGAGQALEQLTARNAARFYGDNPSAEEIKKVADDLSDKVVSIRPDDKTIFSELKIGDESYDNAMVGETYSFKSDDSPSEIVLNIRDHQLKSVARAAFAEGEDGFTRTPDKDHSGSQILEGGENLSDVSRFWTRAKASLFHASLPLLKQLFNEKGADIKQENQDTPRKGFEGMTDDILGCDSPELTQKDNNPAAQTVRAAPVIS